MDIPWNSIRRQEKVLLVTFAVAMVLWLLAGGLYNLFSLTPTTSAAEGTLVGWVADRLTDPLNLSNLAFAIVGSGLLSCALWIAERYIGFFPGVWRVTAGYGADAVTAFLANAAAACIGLLLIGLVPQTGRWEELIAHFITFICLPVMLAAVIGMMLAPTQAHPQ